MRSAQVYEFIYFVYYKYQECIFTLRYFNKRDEFYYKKSHLEIILQQNIIRDGVAYIPCKIDGINDIVTLNEPTAAESYPAPSGLVRQLTRNVRADRACSACYAALVRGLYQAREEGIAAQEKLVIGQGWRGQTPNALGIGNCCSGAARCVKGCPPTAADVLNALREA